MGPHTLATYQWKYFNFYFLTWNVKIECLSNILKINDPKPIK